MRNYPNIENNKNSDGSRTGYDAGGRSWRIYGRYGSWTARANVTRQGSLNLIAGVSTLAEISEELTRTGTE